jgi:hypothetical protein
MKVLIILVVLFMGCALDQEYYDYGKWKGLSSFTFVDDNILIESNSTSNKYEYKIISRFIYIENNNDWISLYRIHQWTKDTLIVREESTYIYHTLIKY